MTTYTHDEAGRLVSSEPEPEWDQGQRDLVQGLALWEAAYLCPNCHGPKAECQAPEAEQRYKKGDPVRCHRTTAHLRESKAIREAGYEYPEGLISGVHYEA